MHECFFYNMLLGVWLHMIRPSYTIMILLYSDVDLISWLPTVPREGARGS